jgi:hypothetical protein
MDSLSTELERVNDIATKTIIKFPETKGFIEDAWSLMITEINDGSSEELEVERFLDEIKYTVMFRSKTNDNQ